MSLRKYARAWLLVLVVLAGCQSGPSAIAPRSVTAAPASSVPNTAVTYAGGDGATQENAVVIQAKSSMVGVRAEHAWLAQHYPGFKLTSQSLIRNAGKTYDLLEIRTSEGQELKVHFDISAFYGKF
jgi:hypothetical protein